MSKQGFISWSGDESRSIAEALKEFFSFALPNPTLFVASKDLQAGEVWFTEIAERLDVCDIGVIVVTPQNVSRPWLHFEAGAISKKVGRSAAIPLLCGVANGELAGTPLAQLQALTVSQTNLRKLTSRLNDLLELGVSEAHIDSTFPVWWERYQDRIDNPEIWKGVAPKKAAPTIADLSVQMAQIAAAVSDLTDRVERSNRRSMPLSHRPRPEPANAAELDSVDRGMFMRNGRLYRRVATDDGRIRYVAAQSELNVNSNEDETID